MKTITVASQPPRDLATADPCNHSFSGCPVPYPVLTALLPHWPLCSPSHRPAALLSQASVFAFPLTGAWLERTFLGYSVQASSLH